MRKGESVEDLAARLGIQLPKSSPPPAPPKPKSKTAPRPRKESESRSKNKGPTCRKGHLYGDHKKMTRAKGKIYEVRYCRTCYTETEARRRARAKQADAA